MRNLIGCLLAFSTIFTISLHANALDKKPSYYDPGIPMYIALQKTKPILVEFYADWCGACSQRTPKISAIAEKMSNKVQFVMVNADKSKSLLNEYNINSFPSLLLINPKTRKKVSIESFDYKSNRILNETEFKQQIEKALKIL